MNNWNIARADEENGYVWVEHRFDDFADMDWEASAENCYCKIETREFISIGVWKLLRRMPLYPRCPSLRHLSIYKEYERINRAPVPQAQFPIEPTVMK